MNRRGFLRFLGLAPVAAPVVVAAAAKAQEAEIVKLILTAGLGPPAMDVYRLTNIAWRITESPYSIFRDDVTVTIDGRTVIDRSPVKTLTVK